MIYGLLSLLFIAASARDVRECSGGYCMELVGNSGQIKLFEDTNDTTTEDNSTSGGDFIKVRVAGLQEYESIEGRKAHNKVSSFPGLPWEVIEPADCDGSGSYNGSGCIQASFDAMVVVNGGPGGKHDLAFGMDVYLYSEDIDFQLGDNTTIPLQAGDLKFSIRLGTENQTYAWPSAPGNVLAANLNIRMHRNDNSTMGSIYYVDQYTLGCGGNWTEIYADDDLALNVTTQNWQRQSVWFGTCAEGPTSIVYDPIITIDSVPSPTSPSAGGNDGSNASAGLNAGGVVGIVIAVLVVAAIGGYIIHRRKTAQRQSADLYTTLDA